MNEIMKYFEYNHLPVLLQATSKPFCDLAKQMNETLPDCEQKLVGLQKLLEAKDAFVRAGI